MVALIVVGVIQKPSCMPKIMLLHSFVVLNSAVRRHPAAIIFSIASQLVINRVFAQPSAVSFAILKIVLWINIRSCIMLPRLLQLPRMKPWRMLWMSRRFIAPMRVWLLSMQRGVIRRPCGPRRRRLVVFGIVRHGSALVAGGGRWPGTEMGIGRRHGAARSQHCWWACGGRR